MTKLRMVILREFWVLSLCKRVNSAHLRWINFLIILIRLRCCPFLLRFFIHPVSIFFWWRLWLTQFLSNYLTSFVYLTFIVIMMSLFTWLAPGSHHWVQLSFWVLVLAVGVVIGGPWVLLVLVDDNWVGEGAVCWDATTACRFICYIDWLV